jgi:hypothetical protein
MQSRRDAAPSAIIREGDFFEPLLARYDFWAHPVICGARGRFRNGTAAGMASHHLDRRTVEELLDDAERYDRWATRTDWNAEVSAKFRRLAADTRARAGARKA